MKQAGPEIFFLKKREKKQKKSTTKRRTDKATEKEEEEEDKEDKEEEENTRDCDKTHIFSSLYISIHPSLFRSSSSSSIIIT